MTDRRTEAFAVLDGLAGDRVVSAERLLATLRSVLERHQSRGGFTVSPLLPGEDYCQWCGRDSPCPDETAVIDALLGPADE